MYAISYYTEGGRRIVAVFGFKRYILSLLPSIEHEADFYNMGKLRFSLNNFKKCLAHHKENIVNVSKWGV